MGMACRFWFSRYCNVIGLIVYIFGQKYITHVGNKPTVEEKKDDVSIVKIFLIFLNHHAISHFCSVTSFSIYVGFTKEGVDHWGYGACLYSFLLLLG